MISLAATMPVCRLPSGPKGQDSDYGERRRGGGGGAEERRGHKRPRSQLSGGPGGGGAGGGWSPPGGAHGGAQNWAPGLFSGGAPSINIPSSGAAYGYSSPRPNPRYTQVRFPSYFLDPGLRKIFCAKYTSVLTPLI